MEEDESDLEEDDGGEEGGHAKGKGQTSMKITPMGKSLNNNPTPGEGEGGKCEDKTKYISEHCFIEHAGISEEMKMEVTSHIVKWLNGTK